MNLHSAFTVLKNCNICRMNKIPNNIVPSKLQTSILRKIGSDLGGEKTNTKTEKKKRSKIGNFLSIMFQGLLVTHKINNNVIAQDVSISVAWLSASSWMCIEESVL